MTVKGGKLSVSDPAFAAFRLASVRQATASMTIYPHNENDRRMVVAGPP